MAKKKVEQEPMLEENSGEMMLEESSSTDVILEENASNMMLEEKGGTATSSEESKKAKKPAPKETAAPAKPTKVKPNKPATKPSNSSSLTDPYTGNMGIVDDVSNKINKAIEYGDWELESVPLDEITEMRKVLQLHSPSTGNRTATTETPKQEIHNNKQTKEEDDNLSNQNGWIAFIAGIASAVYLSFVFFSAMGGWGILLALVIGAFVCCGAAWMLMKHSRQWTKILCWSSFIIIWGGLLANFIVHENINLGTICGSFFTSLSAVGLLGLIVDHKELF